MENLYPQNGEQWHNPTIEPQNFERELTDNDVKCGLGERPDPLKVQHEMEMDPENTLLVSSDRLLYFGGPLMVEDYVTIMVKMPAHGAEPGVRTIRPVAVKRISEDGRTLAFAIDVEKAKTYIESKLNRAVA